MRFRNPVEYLGNPKKYLSPDVFFVMAEERLSRIPYLVEEGVVQGEVLVSTDERGWTTLVRFLERSAYSGALREHSYSNRTSPRPTVDEAVNAQLLNHEQRPLALISPDKRAEIEDLLRICLAGIRAAFPTYQPFVLIDTERSAYARLSVQFRLAGVVGTFAMDNSRFYGDTLEEALTKAAAAAFSGSLGNP